MVAINAEKMNDLAVVECKGRLVSSDAVFKLRDFVQSQAPVRTIALDLSEVDARWPGDARVSVLSFPVRLTRAG